MANTAPPSAGSFLRSPGLKLFLVAGLTLLMTIPLVMIGLSLSERRDRADEAAHDIANGWSGPQTIAGLFLVVPYEGVEEIARDNQRIQRKVRGSVVLLPDVLDIAADAKTEIRSRGIFAAPVYTAAVTLKADFGIPDPSAVAGKDMQIRWDQAYAALAVGDPRGLTDNATLSVAGRSVAFVPGAKLLGLALATIQAPLGFAERPARLVLDTNFSIRGMDRLGFAPLGKDTAVRMRSLWPHPSFDGRFLPASRRIGAGGFEASWNVPYLARGFEQAFVGGGDILPALDSLTFGVRFYQPVDFYQLVDRSLKHALLFIGLAFLAFFVVEQVTGARLHVAQYALIGMAQALFYLLLLSFSEHVGFEAAYGIAAIATVALSSAYAIWSFGTARRAAVLLAVLLMIYGLLYVLLKLEDYALLVGSVALFAALAVVMYATRKIDWYRAAPLAMDKLG